MTLSHCSYKWELVTTTVHEGYTLYGLKLTSQTWTFVRTDKPVWERELLFFFSFLLVVCFTFVPSRGHGALFCVLNPPFCLIAVTFRLAEDVRVLFHLSSSEDASF